MRDDTRDIEERIREAREERLKQDLREQDRRNRELLGQCLKQLRVYLIGLSKEAWAMARDAKRREEYEEIHREEKRMWDEQYPCNEGGEMYYQQEFEFEWM
jgi:hypothetical protein